MNKLNITFERFWLDWHFITNSHKLNKESCRKEWDKCNFSHLKAIAIQSINNYKYSDLTALEYLRIILKPY